MSDLYVFMRVVALLLFFRMTAMLLPVLNAHKPPLSVRVITDLEVAFAACVVLPSLFPALLIRSEALEPGSRYVFIAISAAGFVWAVLCVWLVNRTAWGRQGLLFLSVIRLVVLASLPWDSRNLWMFILRVTVMFGVPVSFVTLYLLLWNDSAKSFLRGAKGE